MSPDNRPSDSRQNIDPEWLAEVQSEIEGLSPSPEIMAKIGKTARLAVSKFIVPKLLEKPGVVVFPARSGEIAQRILAPYLEGMAIKSIVFSSEVDAWMLRDYWEEGRTNDSSGRRSIAVWDLIRRDHPQLSRDQRLVFADATITSGRKEASYHGRLSSIGFEDHRFVVLAGAEHRRLSSHLSQRLDIVSFDSGLYQYLERLVTNHMEIQPETLPFTDPAYRLFHPGIEGAIGKALAAIASWPKRDGGSR